MAVRRSALERVGDFDEDVPIYGDEEEWLLRLHAAGGRVAYVAAAGLDHRRAGDDARLRSLARAEYRRGRAARRSRPPQGHRAEPGPRAAQPGRRRLAHRPPPCPQGLVMGAHSAGRLVEALRGR